MPLTRKQAWRRVRVRQELAEAKDESSPRCSKRAMGDKAAPAERQRQQQQQEEEQQQQRSPERAPKGGSAIKSPERKVLDKWRLPKEGREPSARPGVSASKRQAAAACVRVGSRVSFNTVVAAILIPSAKDLHAAARRELWWQETDYRDFRVNFIQFMRNPPLAIDDMEVSPDDSPADAATSEVMPEEEKQMTVQDLPQPVMVSAIVYEDNTPPCDARAGKSVRAWAVEEDAEEKKEAPTTTTTTTTTTTVSVSSSSVEEIMESDIEARVVAAAATTAAASATAAAAADANASAAAASSVIAAASGAVEVEFSPPAAPSASTLIVEASEAATGSPATTAALPRATTLPTAAVACDSSDYTVGDESDGNTVEDGGGCWDEQESNRRVQPGLTWAPAADAQGEEEEQGEEDGEDNTVRVRRSFSNLETARRLGAGRVSAATGEDFMDSDGGEESASQSRPRALSLDGWFTCGLENGVETKSYETHDHAGRLRELVALPPFPPVTAKPTPQPVSSPQPDLAEAMRELRVTFNVSVNDNTVKGKQGGAGGTEQRNAGTVSNSDHGGNMTHGGETKCRAEEDDAVISFASDTASRNFSDLGAVDSRSIGKMGVGIGGGIQPDFDVCVA